jgi:hypothetical protein
MTSCLVAFLPSTYASMSLLAIFLLSAIPGVLAVVFVTAGIGAARDPVGSSAPLLGRVPVAARAGGGRAGCLAASALGRFSRGKIAVVDARRRAFRPCRPYPR